MAGRKNRLNVDGAKRPCDALDRLCAAVKLSGALTTVPDGYFSADQFGASKGLSENRARQILRAALAEGTVVCVTVNCGGALKKFYAAKG